MKIFHLSNHLFLNESPLGNIHLKNKSLQGLSIVSDFKRLARRVGSVFHIFPFCTKATVRMTK